MAFRILLILPCVSYVIFGKGFDPPDSQSYPSRLWDTAASVNWNDSLLIGNGRLGGAILGSTSSEKVSLNEQTIWTGALMHRVNADAYPTHNKVTGWLTDGSMQQAQYESQLGLTGTPSSTRQYQPGGDVQIVFNNESGSVSNYERWLDLEDATSGVYYTSGAVSYKREYWSSNPAEVIGIRLTASTPGAISLYTKFQRPASSQNRYVDTSYAIWTNRLTATTGESLQYVFGAVVHNVGGKIRQIGDNVEITGADEVWIYLDIETSVSQSNPLEALNQKLSKVLSSTYQKLRQEHITDYQSF
jgi:alpha-L-fucosidase 2